MLTDDEIKEIKEGMKPLRLSPDGDRLPYCHTPHFCHRLREDIKSLLADREELLDKIKELETVAQKIARELAETTQRPEEVEQEQVDGIIRHYQAITKMEDK